MPDYLINGSVGIGQRLLHPVHGEGTVVNVEPLGPAIDHEIVDVQWDGTNIVSGIKDYGDGRLDRGVTPLNQPRRRVDYDDKTKRYTVTELPVT
jgi:hypothetical protein